MVITTSIPVARRFIFWSWRRRSSSRLTGGVDDPDPGTLLMPVVEGDGASRVWTSTAMADGSGDPDLLIPAPGGSYAAAPPGVNVTGRCLIPLMNADSSRDGSPEASMSGMRR